MIITVTLLSAALLTAVGIALVEHCGREAELELQVLRAKNDMRRHPAMGGLLPEWWQEDNE